jgi:ppGpp synthetase/RelA/SpoT-type nucleotidyltranferase
MRASHDTLRQFPLEAPYYAILLNGAVRLLRLEIPQRAIRPYMMTSRLKSLSSTLDKMARRGKTLNEIRDRAGIRITCRHMRAVDQILEVIKALFVTEEVENNSFRQHSSGVGYSAVHCIIRWSPDRVGPLLLDDLSHLGPGQGGTYYVPIWRYRSFANTHGSLDRGRDVDLADRIRATNSSIARLPLEIQIRTILQDAWANVSHELLYKRNGPDKAQAHRRMARLGTILKETDEAFQQELDSEPAAGQFEPNLSRWTSIRDKKLSEKFLQAFALDVLGIQERPSDIEFALKRLNSVGITTENLFQRLMIACIEALDAAFSSVLLSHLRFLHCYVETLVYWFFGVTNITLVPEQLAVFDRNRDLVDEHLLHDVLREVRGTSQ